MGDRRREYAGRLADLRKRLDAIADDLILVKISAEDVDFDAWATATDACNGVTSAMVAIDRHTRTVASHD
jgi:hypothetical protein